MADVDDMGDLEKPDLRTQFLDARRALTADAIEAARARVRDAVLAQCDRRGWRTVAAYRPLRTEPGSDGLLSALVGRGVRVLVPVTLADRDLDWVQVPGDEPLGIAAVEAANAVLVPALAIAADGTRLGRGGGSYDRALARVTAGTTVAALVYDDEVVPWLPAEPWDRPVTDVVTPGGGWRAIAPPGGRGNR